VCVCVSVCVCVCVCLCVLCVCVCVCVCAWARTRVSIFFREGDFDVDNVYLGSSRKYLQYGIRQSGPMMSEQILTLCAKKHPAIVCH